MVGYSPHVAPKSQWTSNDLLLYVMLCNSSHMAPKSLWTSNDWLFFVMLCISPHVALANDWLIYVMLCKVLAPRGPFVLVDTKRQTSLSNIKY